MRRALIGTAIVCVAFGIGPALADHEDDGASECSFSHDKPHYGLYRENPDDPTQWVTQGDPNNPWVGSTSPTGAVWAGRFGGSEGRALYSVGACGVGTTEAAVYQKNGMYYVVVVGDGGTQNPAGNGYQGVNTGYDQNDGSVNKGGALCVGQKSGTYHCTTESTPLMCENASTGKGPNWHETSKNGCDLRQ